jgi:hypothetical protein
VAAGTRLTLENTMTVRENTDNRTGTVTLIFGGLLV